jgi:hypothetical protein
VAMGLNSAMDRPPPMRASSPLLAALTEYVNANGVAVLERIMDVEVPGEFDGTSITLNTVHEIESRSYYLVHSFGSIVAWSVNPCDAQSVFHELRAAKEVRLVEPVRFERALKRFYEFEERASEYAVWVLERIGHAEAISEYTTFFRADAESMSILHRDGTSPPWREFFTEWKVRVARGEEKLRSYSPRPVPSFRPVRIEKQQVVQEVDGAE